MALDIEEQQQIEQVKKWLAEYGLTLVVAIIGAIILLFGYQRWSQMHERMMEHASVRYEQLLDNLAQNKIIAADQSAAYLIKRYPHSTYARLAELLIARRDISLNQYADATQKLTEVMQHGNVASLREIARLRLARLEIQQQQPQKALDTLKDVDANAFLASVAAVRGDAYAALNNTAMARQSYQQAIMGLPEAAILRSMTIMKLNNLPA